MPSTFVTFVLPAALFVGLALIPPGRKALIASLLAAAGLLCLWLGHYLDILGLQTSEDPKRQIYALFLLLGLTLAWFMASSLQVLRKRFPDDWPWWSWPTVVALTLLIVGLGIYRMLTL